MSRRSFRKYGWILIWVLLLVALIVLASSFGSSVSDDVLTTYKSPFQTTRETSEETEAVTDDSAVDVIEKNVISNIDFIYDGQKLVNGSLAEQSGLTSTDYIDITKCDGIFRFATKRLEYIYGYEFYDEDKNLIFASGFLVPKAENYVAYNDYENLYEKCLFIELDRDATYIRITTNQECIDDASHIFKFIPKITGDTAVDDVVSASFPNTSLQGKTVVNFGDSIFGMNNTLSGVGNQIEALTGATVYNCAFGGTRATDRGSTDYQYFDMTTLIDAIISGDFSEQDIAASVNSKFPARLNKIKELDFSNQIVTLNHGTNDWSGNVTIDTYKASLKYVVDQLLSNYTNLHIILLSPTWRCEFEDGAVVAGSGSKINSNGNTVLDFVNAMKDVAAECGVDYIDCYNIGINELNAPAYFTSPDGTHQNREGRIYLAEHISEELVKIVR